MMVYEVTSLSSSSQTFEILPMIPKMVVHGGYVVIYYNAAGKKLVMLPFICIHMHYYLTGSTT